MVKFGFCTILFLPTVLAIVNVHPPDELISHVGGSADFLCIVSSNSRKAVGVKWLVNGTFLERLNLSNVDLRFDPDFASGIGSLKFNDLTLDFNMTSIRCDAQFSSGGNETSTEATILLVQGTLPPVRSLTFSITDSTITYQWTAPLTLNLPDQEDILGYKVQVINSITSVQIHSERVNETQFTFEVPPMSWCYVPLFTVIPVNVVGDGTPRTQSYIGNYGRPTLETLSRVSLVGNIVTYSLISSAPVCSSELTFVDLDTKDSVTLTDSDLIIDGANVTFTTEKLTENRHYTVSVKASNIERTASYSTQLSTHGIADAIVDQTEFRVSTTYFERSSEKGALMVFISEGMNQKVNFKLSAVVALNRTSSLNYLLPFELHAGRYRFFIYDIEQDGRLQSGTSYPAVSTDEITTSRDSSGFSALPTKSPPILKDCEISNSAFRRITVKCTYDKPVGNGFQVIAQLSNSSEVHRLHINETTDSQTSASVDVDFGGRYQVTVFPVRGERGILNSDAEFFEEITLNETLTTIGQEDDTSISVLVWVGLAVGISIGSLIVVVIMFICFLRLKRRPPPMEKTIEQRPPSMEMKDSSEMRHESPGNQRYVAINSEGGEKPTMTTKEQGEGRSRKKLADSKSLSPPLDNGERQPLISKNVTLTEGQAIAEAVGTTSGNEGAQLVKQAVPSSQNEAPFSEQTTPPPHEVETLPENKTESLAFTQKGSQLSADGTSKTSSQKHLAESQSEQLPVENTSVTKKNDQEVAHNQEQDLHPIQSSDDQVDDYMFYQKQQQQQQYHRSESVPLHIKDQSVRERSRSVAETSEHSVETKASAAIPIEADPKAGKATVIHIPSDVNGTLKKLKKTGRTEDSYHTALNQPFQATAVENPTNRKKKIAADKPPSVSEVKSFLGTLEPKELRQLGTTLGLRHATLKVMKNDALISDMVEAWLNKDDDVERTTGEPTWTSLIDALREMDLGGVADTIEAGTYVPDQPPQSRPEFGKETQRAPPRRHTTRNLDQPSTDDLNPNLGGNVHSRFTGEAGSAIEGEIDGEDL